MKHLNKTTIVLFFAFFTPLMGFDDLLVDPETPPRSPEGQRELVSLQNRMIKAFESLQIEKRFLAAHKLKQMELEEVTPDLLYAAIESMKTSNHNYRWLVTHILQKLSRKEMPANIVLWRKWLQEEFVPRERAVMPPAELRMNIEQGSLSSGSLGHDTSGGIAKELVPPSPKLGHDPNEQIVDPEKKAKKKMGPKVGQGRFMGSGVHEDIPKKMTNKKAPTNKTPYEKTNVRKDFHDGIDLTESPEDASDEGAKEEVPPELPSLNEGSGNEGSGSGS